MPRPTLIRQIMLTIVTFLTLLPSLVAAEGETGSGRIRGGQCPNQKPNDTVEATLVFSPFTPCWKFDVPNKTNNDPQRCWIVADCLFEVAGESRKQQFGATALVMGLIPGAVKDIAWPERRLIYVTKQLDWYIETLVLALGLVPKATKKKEDARFLACDGSLLAKVAWDMKRLRVKMCIAVSAFALAISYASLAIMELYSKRSALGCVAPIFILAWHLLALVPASIHSIFARLRRQRFQRKALQRSNSLQARRVDCNEGVIDNLFTLPSSERPKLLHRTLGQHLDGNDEGEGLRPGAYRDEKIISAIQGANEDWPVQMAWGVYYIAGTLVFTSIMAVTVPELVVWVALGLATTGCSKILAFFLCLVNEETGPRWTGRTEPLAARGESDNLGVLPAVDD